MQIRVKTAWRLRVGIGPAEHGVYRRGHMYLAPTFRDQFWKVDAKNGRVLRTFKMPGHVWGAPWVDETGLYGASTGGHIAKFSSNGEIVWKANPGLGDFISEAVTKAWGGCIAVQFPRGVAILDKSDGKALWCDEWSPEAQAGQEPTFDPETELLWVCRPLRKNGLVAYDLGGRRVLLKNLPSPPTHYACAQIWTRYVLVICSRHVAVFDRSSGKQIWSRDFSTVKYGGKDEDSLRGGPRVITSNGKLVVWTANGLLYCINIKNGKTLWSLDFERLGYASEECTDPWGYAGGTAVDGVFTMLGRNNLPKDSNSPFTIDKNRLFIIDCNAGQIVYVSEPIHQMSCCCKPIVARGRIVIGSWYKDSKEEVHSNYYTCWKIDVAGEAREVLDRDYTWLGGPHHGGYSAGCLLGFRCH